MFEFMRAIRSRSGARRRVLAETGEPVVSMWYVTLCFTGRSLEHTCVTAGNSARRAENLFSGSLACNDGRSDEV